VRRILLILCPLAAIWAVAVALSGGFVVRVGSFRVLSSRDPWNPAIIAALSGLAAWAFTPPAERRRLLTVVATSVRSIPRIAVAVFVRSPVRAAGRTPPQLAAWLAAIAAVLVVMVGLVKGAPYVGGADVYGYVSQSDLWAMGRLRMEQPLVRDLSWPFAAEALAPLGYRPSLNGTAIVPVYPPGYPMVMAVFRLVAGREAVFWVVPLLGGIAIWATYLMGGRLAGPLAGASAALLLATSPTFLFQLLLPMSDVPVTAWWALALALLLRERRRAALLSGLAAGVAILTRPNLVPLSVIPGAVLAWRAYRERDLAGPAAGRLFLFAAGVVPACLGVALLNTLLYGSPLAAGYGTFDTLYSWNNLTPNLERYTRWLLQTETPVVLLALLAPFVAARKDRIIMIAWLSGVAVVLLSYLFHTPNNTWFWLRYILPAFPLLFSLIGVALAAVLARLDRGVRLIVTALVIGSLSWHGIAFAVNDGIFGVREGERKSLMIGEHIARRLSDRAIFISLQHSGSVRYYSGRLTLRLDRIPEEELDLVIADLRRLGYRPYVLLEGWEEREFRNRFARHSGVGRLDWAPAVLLDHSTKVRIYDPADRDAPAADRPPTETIR
jgi:hypothetical protein